LVAGCGAGGKLGKTAAAASGGDSRSVAPAGWPGRPWQPRASSGRRGGPLAPARRQPAAGDRRVRESPGRGGL